VRTGLERETEAAVRIRDGHDLAGNHADPGDGLVCGQIGDGAGD